MKRSLIILVFLSSTILLSAITFFTKIKTRHADIVNENVEALTSSEGFDIGSFIGCPGGNVKCFTGTVEYKGLKISGTWYKTL